MASTNEQVMIAYDKLVIEGIKDSENIYNVFSSLYSESDLKSKVRILEGMTIMYRQVLFELHKLKKGSSDQIINMLSGVNSSDPITQDLTKIANRVLNWLTQHLLKETDETLCQTVALFYITNHKALPLIPLSRFESKFKQMHQVLIDENPVYAEVAANIRS